MLIKQSSLKTVGRKRNKALAFFVSTLFFVSVVTLYSTLGTFFSSCSPSTVTYHTVKSSIGYRFLGNEGCHFLPMGAGSLIDFGTAVSNGWYVRVTVNKAENGSALKTYDFVNSYYDSGGQGASVSSTMISGISMPDNIPYTVSMIIMAPCNCNITQNYTAHYLRHSSGQYNTGTAASSILGNASYWQQASCSLIF